MALLQVIVYASSACYDMAEVELGEMIRVSAARNRAADLTGALMHADGNYLQCMEGVAANIAPVFESIQRDVRHRGLLILLEQPVIRRGFDDYHFVLKPAADAEAVLLSKPGESVVKDLMRAVWVRMRRGGDRA